MKTRFAFLAIMLAALGGTAFAEKRTCWIGTGGGNAKGIYRLEFNAEDGSFSKAELAAEVGSPGFLALHPNGRVLYAACQIERTPSVAAYVIAADASSLSLLNAQPIGDGGATHVSVDATGKMLLTAQYGGGSTAVFPLNEDGSVGERSQLIEHEGGSKVVGNRQDSPHPHWTGFDPANRFAFVPDLGLDRVLIYRADPANAKLEPHGEGIVPPGSGPRHFKFHPNGKFAYVINELNMSVTAFRYDAAAGALEPIQTIETVPPAEIETFCSGSEIRVHPSGKFVYAANRGHDTVTAFRCDPATGMLEFIEREPIRGSWPRNFNLDPTGKWLIAAGANSNTLAVFQIDQEKGNLVFNLKMAEVPSPICVLFQP